MTEKDIEKLIEDYQKAKNEISELTTEISVLKEEMAVMQNQLDWFKRQMFGRKTEQTSVILEGGEQLSMFADIGNFGRRRTAFHVSEKRK